jgi:hypothetical protein
MSSQKDVREPGRTQPPESEEQSRRKQDREERQGDPEGLDKSWHGPDEASGHGSYVGRDFGRDTRESNAPDVTPRSSYVGTRMGDWDEGEATAGSESLPRRSHGAERRRRDRELGR